MITKSETVAAPPAEVFGCVKRLLEAEPQVQGKIQWDDAMRVGRIDLMGVRVEISVTDASALDTVASVGFPASLKVSEEKLGHMIDRIYAGVHGAFKA